MLVKMNLTSSILDKTMDGVVKKKTSTTRTKKMKSEKNKLWPRFKTIEDTGSLQYNTINNPEMSLEGFLKVALERSSCLNRKFWTRNDTTLVIVDILF